VPSGASEVPGVPENKKGYHEEGADGDQTVASGCVGDYWKVAGMTD
jgi:hypothetical protein